MNKAFLVVLLSTGAACGGYQAGELPEPKSPNAALDQFLHAVKAKDTRAMSSYWGNENGPWHKVPPAYRDSVLQAFQFFLRHDSYRVLDGPIAMTSGSSVVTFHVELQAPGCVRTQPFDVGKTKKGGWLVFNVHLEAESKVVPHCPPPA